MYVIFITLLNVFDKHRGKYVKPDFVKFISLEINYFVETGFLLRNIDTLLFEAVKISPLSLFFISFIFILFSPPSSSLTVTTR